MTEIPVRDRSHINKVTHTAHTLQQHNSISIITSHYIGKGRGGDDGSGKTEREREMWGETKERKKEATKIDK